MRAKICISIASMFALLFSTNICAETLKCVGMDGEGQTVNVLYDLDTDTVNINGQILKVEAGTEGENGVATEDYETTSGKHVYASLVVEGKDKIILRQFLAKDDTELATVPLACK